MPYLAHFGLEEHPFTLTPNVDYFFPTQEHANIIASVEFALRRDSGIIKVVGDVGTGKTLLCRMLVRKLVDTDAVAYINAPRADANSIILAICEEFGLSIDDKMETAYGVLNRFLVEQHEQGRMAVVVVDEAQHLGKEGLEAVRLVSNLETEKSKLLQIVLFGQTELDDLLRDPALRQLNQRVVFPLTTKPLTPTEARNYVTHRIRVSRRQGIVYDVFSPRALDLIATRCGGIPRIVNIVADKALLAAFAEGSPVVQPSHVVDAIKDSPGLVPRSAGWSEAIARGMRRFGAKALAVVAAAVLAFGLWATAPSWYPAATMRSLVHAVAAAAAVFAQKYRETSTQSTASATVEPKAAAAAPEPAKPAAAPAEAQEPVTIGVPAPAPAPATAPASSAKSAPTPAPVSATQPPVAPARSAEPQAALSAAPQTSNPSPGNTAGSGNAQATPPAEPSTPAPAANSAAPQAATPSPAPSQTPTPAVSGAPAIDAPAPAAKLIGVRPIDSNAAASGSTPTPAVSSNAGPDMNDSVVESVAAPAHPVKHRPRKTSIASARKKTQPDAQPASVVAPAAADDEPEGPPVPADLANRISAPSTTSDAKH